MNPPLDKLLRYLATTPRRQARGNPVLRGDNVVAVRINGTGRSPGEAFDHDEFRQRYASGWRRLVEARARL